jgi:NADP-dependent 3-hydroxy acid dehydrogenase YdfG
MLAGQGARVVLAAGRQAALEQVADSVRERGGYALPIVTDLTNDASLRNLIERTRAELGKIEVLGQ